MARDKKRDGGTEPAGEGEQEEKFTQPVKLRKSWKLKLQLVATRLGVEMGEVIEALAEDKLDHLHLVLIVRGEAPEKYWKPRPKK